jgi:fatty-acyl-CoA synthase
MCGYWDQPEKTDEVLDAERWMHTGDLATIDDEGFCNIVGRIKDLVIRGGENVYPREVEEYLYRHPKIQDVQVFGIADAKYGEELCAWVRLKAGEDLSACDLQAFCEGQIAYQKIPRHVRFVDAFPTTITGKVQKYKMREAMEEEFGVTAAKTA